MTVKEYIKQNIGDTICYHPIDDEKRLGIPYPYTVPTVGETFHSMYYWDTYFTNLGLLKLGNISQVKNNIENLATLIERFGFIPNGSARCLCDRSQPPFFALMIRDLFAETGDLKWLAHIYPYLCLEHDFWTNKRNTTIGLAHYGTMVERSNERAYAHSFSHRIGEKYKHRNKKLLAENFLSQAESGWDFNARFGFDSMHFCPADLNSLLWSIEDNLADFAAKLNNGEEEKWRSKANDRAERMRSFLKDETGAFRDRNAETGAFSPYVSAAILYPLFVGLATQEEAKATVALLPRILHKWGVVPCEEVNDGHVYQWGAPNGWPCIQVIAVTGLRKYGYTEEADKIAQSYVTMVENVFEKTGALWEKYNLDTGNSDAVNEYEMPEMLGWTAGAYLYFKQ